MVSYLNTTLHAGWWSILSWNLALRNGIPFIKIVTVFLLLKSTIKCVAGFEPGLFWYHFEVLVISLKLRSYSEAWGKLFCILTLRSGIIYDCCQSAFPMIFWEIGTNIPLQRSKESSSFTIPFVNGKNSFCSSIFHFKTKFFYQASVHNTDNSNEHTFPVALAGHVLWFVRQAMLSVRFIWMVAVLPYSSII